MSNRSFAYSVLRFGLALTFVLIGFMILGDPAGWGGFVKPWARELIPGTVEGFMRIVGIADIVIGGFIALGVWVRAASGLAALHLAGILIVSGVDAVTVRDIGLLSAAIALAVWSGPQEKIRTTDGEGKKEEGNNE